MYVLTSLKVAVNICNATSLLYGITREILMIHTRTLLQYVTSLSHSFSWEFELCSIIYNLLKTKNDRSLFCHWKQCSNSCSNSGLQEKTKFCSNRMCLLPQASVIALYFSEVRSKHFFFYKRKEVQSNKLSHTNTEQGRTLLRPLKLMGFCALCINTCICFVEECFGVVVFNAHEIHIAV